MKLSRRVLASAFFVLLASSIHGQQPTGSSQVVKIPAELRGGFETDPRDHGRPVVLIAAALGVAPEVFRDAFSGVHPAGPGTGGPTREEAQANKAVLMGKLSKYGVTNERLDEVSNFYRYAPRDRDLWKHKAAEVNAVVKNGAVTAYEIVSPGAGYSSAPTITVPGVKTAAPSVKLGFGKDLKTNGSISSVEVNPAG